MPTILIVEKTGVVKESNIKSWVEEDLYKKAGFKSPEGFGKAHEWTIDGTTVALYGKTDGRAGQENKYDFPPPVDTTLFFGACILTVADGSLKAAQWEKMYEALFGGFEDVGGTDSDESDDEDDELDLPRTKDGYVKDGFIVDDDDDEEDVGSEEEDDDGFDEGDTGAAAVDRDVEPVVEPSVKSKPIPKKSAAKPEKKKLPVKRTPNKKLTVFEKIDTEGEEPSLISTNELEEELYI